MLQDSELTKLEAQLRAARLSSQKEHESLQKILQNYTTLVDDYRRLKSDYEEERESREKYKKVAKGQERNPFVLVLIDGDNYIFNDDLVQAHAEGGKRAAELLARTAHDYLHKLGPYFDQCSVVVRIYANLRTLSIALSNVRLAGKEMRSLARFTSGFTGSHKLFDFIDVGDAQAGVSSSLKGTLTIEFYKCHFTAYTERRQITFAYLRTLTNVNILFSADATTQPI